MLGGLFARIAQFWLGSFAAEFVVSVVAIYAFDFYEPGYGTGISLQVSTWVAMLVAAISATGFGIGMKVFGKKPTRLWCILSGAIIAMVTLAADAIGRAFLQTDVLYEIAVLVAALVLPLVAAYSARVEAARA